MCMITLTKLASHFYDNPVKVVIDVLLQVDSGGVPSLVESGELSDGRAGARPEHSVL